MLEIEWAAEDALPFALCLSTIGAAPACATIDGITVARGNVLLVDHGQSLPDEPLPPVPGSTTAACCDCEGQPSDVVTRAARFRPTLAQAPVTQRVPLPTAGWLPASKALVQDPRAALPAANLIEANGTVWEVAADLLASQIGRAHV